MDFSIILMAILVACYGVTLELLWKSGDDNVFRKANWLLYTALTLSLIGFFTLLPILTAVLTGTCTFVALFFTNKKNSFGAFLAALLGLFVVLGTAFLQLKSTM